MPNPVVLLPACWETTGEGPRHTVQSEYIEAVARAAGCAPLILPALGRDTDWNAIMSIADGIVLTGSPSNVHPSLFGESVLNPALPLDPVRDETTLPLIREVVERGIPLMAICRGAQEVNVALGGSLYQAIHSLPDMMDHREPNELPYEEQYGPAHPVYITEGGKMHAMLSGASEIVVNSLHGQGIARLADGLVIEARAEDGLVEAFSIGTVPSFTLCVQWHPEWQVLQNPASRAIFDAFGAACREYRRGKDAGEDAQQMLTTETAWA